MKFRYFDPTGSEIAWEQLVTMGVSTPVMEHVFATVLERVENSGNDRSPIENAPAG